VKEARTIIADIRKGDGVLIDLENMKPADAVKLMDLVSGGLLMINGSYKRLANKMFLVAPTQDLLDKYLTQIDD
jgi:cell division inhibitor SepF